MARDKFVVLAHTCRSRDVVRFLRLDVVLVKCFRILKTSEGHRASNFAVAWLSDFSIGRFPR